MANWIFRGNREDFKIDSYLSEFDYIYWSVKHKKHQDSIQVGDSVFIWRSKGKSKDPYGVVAHGKIVEAPVHKDNVKHSEFLQSRLSLKPEISEYKTGIELDGCGLTIDQGLVDSRLLIEDSEVSKIQLLTAKQGTNFEITNSVYNKIYFLWSVNLSEINEVEKEYETDESKVNYRLHKIRERDPVLVKKAKERFIKENGSLFCEACGYSFVKVYGINYIEAHHKMPLSKIKAGEKTRESDLGILCANCHRAVHRIKDLDTSGKLMEVHKKLYSESNIIQKRENKMKAEISTYLASGQLARLIPTVADSKKEERATSSLLASFMVVPLFAREVLSGAGAPVGKRLKITCYTEVTFKSTDKGKKPRPDGLIVIQNGSKVWTALVESKIGNSELTNTQVEEYLDLAKQYNINAVITISNQFATTPTHHPLTISKNKTKSVELYHFSWLSLKSKAVLLTGNQQVDDPEQAYILSELVRYLDHDSSGVSALTKMPTEWKDACNSIQQGTPITKNCESVERSVSGWHQLLRHLTLNLSMAISQPVDISLSRARAKDPEVNFQEDCNLLSKENKLHADFEIPNAASKLSFSADLLRRTINISMKLDAPKDKSRATASINWITRQLKGDDLQNISLRAYWPKRIPMTVAPLSEIMEDPNVLIPPGTSEIPTYIEVIRVVDLAARFKGAKTFVEEASKEFPKFYHDVGQQLTKWVAKAPKVKEPESIGPTIPTIFSTSDDIILTEINSSDTNSEIETSESNEPPVTDQLDAKENDTNIIESRGSE